LSTAGISRKVERNSKDYFGSTISKELLNPQKIIYKKK
jgi:hypothetical protein